MVKLLVWMAGDCFLIFAIDRYGYWREAAALAVLVAAFAWILGGALWLSLSLRGGKGGLGLRAAEVAALRESARQAEQARKDAEAAK